jgi:hypothetical protein
MKNKLAGPRLLVLDPKNGRILSLTPEGTEIKIVAEGCGKADGIEVDPVNRQIYWTNMGEQTPNTEHFYQNDGTIERIDYDGSNRTIIVPKGKTFTPKQLTLDIQNRKVYWCDREGMRVMCVDMDGNNLTTLIESGRTEKDREDETRHCVGIALDIERGLIYWSQKGPAKGGLGRIFRAGLRLPAGADPAKRKDIDILWDFLPEPIDLKLDHENGYLYWTDRGSPPDGNTLNRASVIQIPPHPELLVGWLKEAIGLTLDPENNRAFFGDLGGNIYVSHLDGSNSHIIYATDTCFTGITYVPTGL